MSTVHHTINIAVMDSGAGGLTIFDKLIQNIPYAHYAYLYDNAFQPYGTKSNSEVIDRSHQILDFFLQHHKPDIFVVACNTASTVALDSLREKHKNIQIVGVVPAIKPAASVSKNKKIAVLATPRTIEGTYLQGLINQYGQGNVFIKIALPHLVQIVEKMFFANQLKQFDNQSIILNQPHWKEIDNQLTQIRQFDCDTVVLGCTHYPHVTSYLKQLCPNVDNWLDSSDAISKRVEQLIQTHGASAIAKTGIGQRLCYFTKLEQEFNNLTYLKSLGTRLFAAELI